MTSSVSVTSSPSFDRRAAAAARAGRRAWDDHPLARQMLGERLARRPLAGEGCHARSSWRPHASAASSSSVAEASSSSSCSSSWSSRRALRSERCPNALAPQLLDLQLQMRDQRLVAGSLGPQAWPLLLSPRPARPRVPTAAASGSRHRPAGASTDVIVVTEEHKAGGLWVSSMYTDSICRIGGCLSACHLGSPGVLRMAPVDPFEQVAKLPRRDHHHAIDVAGQMKRPFSSRLA